MTIAADIALDYLHIDGIETVTFTDLDGNATTNVKGLRGELTYREQGLQAVGSFQDAEVAWELWSATLGGEVPIAGCIVTDADSIGYSILSAREVAIGLESIKWRCLCKKRV